MSSEGETASADPIGVDDLEEGSALFGGAAIVGLASREISSDVRHLLAIAATHHGQRLALVPRL